VTDADEIRNLLGVYCELMDSADWDAVGQMFAHARLVTEDGTPFAVGADAVRALYVNGTKMYDGSPCTRHVTTNSIIEIDGDAARVRSSYVVFQMAPGQALQPIITGRYRDELMRIDGAWRFAQRCFLVDHVGDLSHHLTYEVPQA
jgi:3-phenylpropionate/cinnamic acid dioxygenase small subunit